MTGYVRALRGHRCATRATRPPLAPRLVLLLPLLLLLLLLPSPLLLLPLLPLLRQQFVLPPPLPLLLLPVLLLQQNTAPFQPPLPLLMPGQNDSEKSRRGAGRKRRRGQAWAPEQRNALL